MKKILIGLLALGSISASAVTEQKITIRVMLGYDYPTVELTAINGVRIGKYYENVFPTNEAVADEITRVWNIGIKNKDKVEFNCLAKTFRSSAVDGANAILSLRDCL